MAAGKVARTYAQKPPRFVEVEHLIGIYMPLFCSQLRNNFFKQITFQAGFPAAAGHNLPRNPSVTLRVPPPLKQSVKGGKGST